jgi:serine/threonine protein kinase
MQEQLPPLHSLRLAAGGGRLPASLEDFLRRCLTREERDRWTAAQLLEHPFLRDSLPRTTVAGGPEQQQQQPAAEEDNRAERRSPSPLIGRCKIVSLPHGHTYCLFAA